MAMRASRVGRIAAVVVAFLVVAVLGAIVGVAVVGTGVQSATESAMYAGYAEDAAAPMAEMDAAQMATKEMARGGADAAVGAETLASSETQAMIIYNASVEIQVDDLEAAIKRVRSAAQRLGADVTDLSVQGGDPQPRPLAEPDAGISPGFASMTLRVDADKLDSLKAAVAKAGTVLSEGSTATDVTEQHVDLAARLKNLKAEEARLRGFFDRATDVDDLLAIERELARVRGEIEAMQAQVDYLERQVTRATLTISLSEPGPIITPDGSWGFAEAIRRGIQAAAAVVTTLITVLIALLPIAALVFVVWLIVRVWRKARRGRGPKLPTEPDGTETDSEERAA